MSTELIGILKKERLVAMKAGDEQVKSVLSVLLGEIDRNRGSKELDDTLAMSVAEKMISSIKENVAIAVANGTDKSDFESQIAIIRKFVPEKVLMSEDDTRELIRSIIAAGANNIGLVMKGIGSAQVDKGLASRITRELLA